MPPGSMCEPTPNAPNDTGGRTAPPSADDQDTPEPRHHRRRISSPMRPLLPRCGLRPTMPPRGLRPTMPRYGLRPTMPHLVLRRCRRLITVRN